MAGLVLGVSGQIGLASAGGGDVGGEIGVPSTYSGHAYAARRPPSADKPQSKLWYLDDSWWALMVQEGGTRVTIHELMPDHRWRDTGTLVDSRPDSTGDALWSSRDDRLYVSSRAPGSNLQVNAFGYSPSTRSWSTAPGYPVGISSGGTSESASIDQDSLGRLWVTYTRASRVWVAHSTTDRRTWTAGFQPAVGDTVITWDDLSALIAFGDRVGVMYSDQQSGGFHFAIHRDTDPDTVWHSEDIDSMPDMADDHINLKQLVGDPQGRIFAAIKTSADENPDGRSTDPLVGVLVRTPQAGGSGSWSFAPAGTVADDHTRPLIMIDATNQDLYFFATAPMKGGDIYYKKAPLADVRFGAGRGAPFVDAKPLVNNATGSKDPVSAESGLVVLAVAHGKKLYVHGEMRLAGTGAWTEPTPTETATPTQEATPTETATPGDGDAPTVTGRVPGAGATSVKLWTNVETTFSETVQGVDDTTFTLTEGPTGAVVPAQVSRVSSSDTWRLNPDAKLAPDTTYTVRLVGGASGITDLAGTPLVTTDWGFLTGPPPKVGWRSPKPGATGVSRTRPVRVTFSEDVLNVGTSTFLLRDANGGTVDATVVDNDSSRKWVLRATSDLSPYMEYTVTVLGGADGITDLAGNPLETESWSYTTGS